MILLIIFTLFILSINTCPTICNCTINNFNCQWCLAKFKKSYNKSFNTCQCLEGFKKNQRTDYCVPKYCKVSYNESCTSCRQNWVLNYNSIQDNYQCICKPNFQFNQTTQECVCNSTFFPDLYYYSNITGCISCPPGCKCTNKGCISCSQNYLRTISTDLFSQSYCTCAFPYEQNINQLCQCPKGCSCQNNLLVCPLNTSRQIINQHIQCKHPYIKRDNLCICMYPYYINDITNQCVCYSKMDIRRYYQYKSICYQCPYGCICTEKGCVYCQKFSNRQIVDNNCSCIYPYQEVYLNQCVCVQPYYLSDKGCDCLSNKFHLLYYFDDDNNNCVSCPINCICDINGCNNCTDQNRIISQNSTNKSTCYCKKPFVEVNGRCICPLPYIQQSSNCVCANIISSTQVYYNNDSASCLYCPYNCICNISGCIYCTQNAYRIIIKQSSQYICSCNYSFIEDKYGNCVCPFTSILNTITLNCQCNEPYYYDTTSKICKCKSDINSSAYYSSASQCFSCPQDCKCNQNGCIQCSSNSLRYILQLNINSFICKCVQNSFFRLIDNSCIKCPTNSYYFYQSCINCSSYCLECNIYGCIKCQNNFILKDGYCLCTNGLIYYNKQCNCQSGTYFNGSCLFCPPNCNDCQYSNFQIKCISCFRNVYRKNDPEENCPCQQNLIQKFPIMSYCCHWTCLQCDINGCLSCHKDSYRQLFNNGSYKVCNCKSGSFANNSLLCECKYNYYKYQEQCISCPINCATCYYDYTINNTFCSTCQNNSYRNSDNHLCQCLPGFEQFNPIIQFCFPSYCLQFNQNVCKKCRQNWTLNKENLCQCVVGFYPSIIQNQRCKPCQIDGCIQCSHAAICSKCNISHNYFLTETTCRLLNFNFIYMIVSKGINLQITTDENINGYYIIKKSIKASIHFIQTNLKNPDLIIRSLNLLPLMALITSDNTIFIMIQNTNTTLYDVVCSISFELGLNHSDGSTESKTYNFNYYFQVLLGEKDLLKQVWFQWYWYLIDILIIGIMMASLVLYLRGYKYNHIIFYLQSISLLTSCSNVFHSKLYLIMIRFMYSYYYFWFAFLNPFFSYINRSLYFQKSINKTFVYYNNDMNILRNCGNLIMIIIIGGTLWYICRLVYYFGSNKLKKKVKNIKKIIYRLVQYFFKLAMFPLLFFSCMNLYMGKGQKIQGKSVKYISNVVSIFFILYYPVNVIITFFLEETSKMHKYQNLLELFHCMLAAIYLVFFTNTSYLIYFPLIFFSLRAITFIGITKYFIKKNDFDTFVYWRVIVCVIEILSCTITIVMEYIIIQYLTVLVGMICELIYPIIYLYRYQKTCKLQRIRLKQQNYDKCQFD